MVGHSLRLLPRRIFLYSWNFWGTKKTAIYLKYKNSMKICLFQLFLKMLAKALILSCVVGDVVELVSEQLASSEEVERARSLQLPDNFYLYRLRPRCPGCRGCEEHEEGESPPQQQKPVGQAFAGLVGTNYSNTGTLQSIIFRVVIFIACIFQGPQIIILFSVVLVARFYDNAVLLKTFINFYLIHIASDY